VGGVRVGFFGAGLISNMHHAFLAASSVAPTIVGVHDIVGERAAAWAARTGAAVMAPDELLDAVDAIYVTTWTATHPPLVAAAAERGIAVFCEKPLGVSAVVVEEMVDVVERAGIVNHVGLLLRAVPAWIHVRRLVADPRAGRLMAVSFRDDQYIPNQGRYASTWRVDPALAGRGALLEHSIHDVDVLRWVGGEVAAVSGTTREFHGHDRIDDVAVARLEYVAGGVAALTSVWHDVLERPSLRFVELFCERLHIALDGDSKGMVRWQFTGSPVETRTPDELVAECLTWSESPDIPTTDVVTVLGGPILNPATPFLTAVRDGGPSPLPFAEALPAHRIVDAIYRSADADGGVVTV
jgi:predicted dehydrogenase